MNVIFVEPAFPANQREFVRALAAAGAHVTGVGERPADWLDDELRNWLADYVQIPSVVDEDVLTDVVRHLQAQAWVDRMEATVEAHILPVARVRETCAIPGVSARTAFLCRDKPAMKQALREAGIACARSTRASSPAEVRAFAAETGLPLILKPPDGAGARSTFKVSTSEELEHALDASGVSAGVPVAVEEFIAGHEGYLDTLTVNGEVVHEFVTHYYPNVLEAMRTRWISPQMVTTNRLEEPGYLQVRALARRVIEALDIGTSATHMEWFFGPKGLKFSEIGCRPPGVCQWEVYNAANEFDLYRDWAEAILHQRTLQRPTRHFACGMIALRPECDGRISGYDGLEEIGERYRDCVVAAHFPPPGTPTQPVEAGYMANAWMRVRHPDYDMLRGMLDDIGRSVRVRADA